MTLRHWAGRLPLVKRLYRGARARRRDRALEGLRRALETCGDAGAAPLREAVGTLRRETAADRETFAAIERERARLAADASPLVDGSLGEGFTYDAGSTVADACQVSESPRAARLLYGLARAAGDGPALELGTNVGISSAYIAAGLRAAGGGGAVTTLDASPYRQRLARGVHSNLGLENVSYVLGEFTATLAPTLEQLGTVRLAFIDGHHQYRPTLDYFEQTLPYAAPGAIFVFDDVRWSDGMKKAWAELRADARFGVAADFGTMGVCVLADGSGGERFVSDPVRVLEP